MVVADGGGGGASAGRVEIDIARIKEIATSTMAQIQDDAHTDSASFRNTKLSDGAFGGIPEGVEFGNQAQAAQDLFQQVISEIVAELESFRDNLKQSAETHDSNDQAVETTMAAMNSRYSQAHTWTADATYDRERTGNKDLDVDTGAADQSGDQSGDQAQLDHGTDQPSTAPAAGTDSGGSYGSGENTRGPGDQ